MIVRWSVSDDAIEMALVTIFPWKAKVVSSSVEDTCCGECM